MPTILRNRRTVAEYGACGMVFLLGGCLGTEPEEGSQEVNVAAAAAPLKVAVDGEVLAFARASGITTDDAQQRLTRQSLASDLTEALASKLDSQFGGVWIDLDSGRVQVGVVGEADVLSSASATVRQAIEAVGMDDGYDVISVRFALSALERANDWIGTELERVNVNAGMPADATLTAGLRTDANAIELEAPTGGGLSAAQENLIANAQAQFGDMIVIGTYAGKPEARVAACSYPNCNAPLRSGVLIFTPNFSCTGGFTAVDPSSGNARMFTAGHCSGPTANDQTWNYRNMAGTNLLLGVGWLAEFDSGGDMQSLNIGGFIPGSTERAWVYVTSGPDTTLDETYVIHDTRSSVVGMRICTTGAAFGTSDCGNVTQLGVTLTYTARGNTQTVHNLGRGSFCGTGGDSGAPMYAAHHAYGLQVSGFSQCDSVYQGINTAQNVLGINVLTE